MQIHIIIYLCEHGAVIVGLISTRGLVGDQVPVTPHIAP
jgi:hypothetical protein